MTPAVRTTYISQGVAASAGFFCLAAAALYAAEGRAIMAGLGMFLVGANVYMIIFNSQMRKRIRASEPQSF